ncbi:MAG: hypothetical protein ACREFP_18850 [Acetobacteraceae bacterium]
MPKHRLRHVVLSIAAAVLLLLPAGSRAAGDGSTVSALLNAPMSFHIVPHGGSGFTKAIFAIGDIKGDTADEFARFVHDNNMRGLLIRGTQVYLFSGGGDLDQGLALGETIRKFGFATVVGVPVASNGLLFPPRDEPGGCASACTFAFLGGIARTVAPGSKFLVHRFFYNNNGVLSLTTQNQTVVSVQKEAGRLVAYINEMGIAPGFYTLMTTGGNGGKNPPLNLTQPTLDRLRVTTVQTITTRTLYPANQAPVLQLREENGDMLYSRMDLFCAPPHELMLRAYFPYVMSQPPHLNVKLTTYGPSGQAANFTVPPNDFSIGQRTSGTLPVDLYVPPGRVFRALQGASGIAVEASGPGLSLITDLPVSVSIGNGPGGPQIPAGVHSRILAVARSC